MGGDEKMKAPNWDVAFALSTSKSELDTIDIMKLFGVSRTSAQVYKRKILQRQIEENIKSWYSRSVNLKFAFQEWGINIVEIEKNIAKRKKLESKFGIAK